MTTRQLVLILDFGSQYTQLIARRIREENVYCEIHPCTLAHDQIQALKPSAIVLSGGPSSVFEDGAPTVDAKIYELGLPILGICYGMQLTSHLLGGHVEKADHREYGSAKVEVKKAEGIFSRFAVGEQLDVWMSHGDRVASLPKGFAVLGETPSAPFAAAADLVRKFYCVQFHPEVAHTTRGSDILRAFLFDIAKVEPNWTPGSFVENSLRRISETIGDGHAICGLSGGVDSTVAAVLVARAIKTKLTCIFVDNGLLRKDEAKQVVQMFKDEVRCDDEGKLPLNVVHVDASERFLRELEGVSDPETKRKIIGRVFVEVFDEEAKKIKGATHLVQGTLYPDVIESVSFKGPSALIKTHHNVGGLPEKMNLKLCEPLRELFKDEVREVGQTLGIPKPVLFRHPFPGPGLAIRCIGAIEKQKLDVLREADAIFIEELKKEDLYGSVWQAFAVILPIQTVGVMGDGRTYENVLSLRAVGSRDGMTADWSRLPHEFLAKVSGRIINEVRGINRVVYDISSKPPATIEWE